MTPEKEETAKEESEILINADRDQFLVQKEAMELQNKLNDALLEARAGFGVAVVLSQGYHPRGAYVTQGDDPGEELYDLIWGNLTIESAGIFAAYANRRGWDQQILRSLDRLTRKGYRVGWWVRGYFQDRVNLRS